MTVIDFQVPAIPVAQPRAKAVSIAGKARVYDDQKHPVQTYKACVRLSFAAAYSGAPLDCPLFMRLVCVLPRLASMPKQGPRVPHTKRKDIDNLFKSTTDALNGLAWVDDGRIYSAAVSKWYAASDEQPHSEIRIEAGGER